MTQQKFGTWTVFMVLIFSDYMCWITDALPTASESSVTPDPTSKLETSTQYEYIGLIRKCPSGTDDQINECFALILADLKPKLAAGIPEINLPPLDPLLLDKLDFKQGRGAVVIKAEFMDVKIKGLSNFTRAAFIINRHKKVMDFEMFIPRIRIDGTYSLGGNILVFPIGGTGPYWFDIGSVEVKGQLELKLVNGNVTGAVAVNKIELDLKIGNIKIQLLNLFNGNQVLGPVINNVINENGLELFQEIKPGVVKQVSGIIKTIANAVLANLSFLGKLISD